MCVGQGNCELFLASLWLFRSSHDSVESNTVFLFLPLIFLGHCFGLIPASCSFAASAFPVPPSTALGSPHKAAGRFGSRSHSLLGGPKKMGKKKEKIQSCLTCLTCMLSGIALVWFARRR